LIEAQTDPDLLAAARAAPLTPEQLSQQNDLRKDYAHFQQLLATAEQDISLLRAKVASQQGKARGQAHRAAPTVEAVMATIVKITSMAEERSGDVDVLESQMRQLRATSTEGSSTPGPENSLLVAATSRSAALRPRYANGAARSSTPEAFTPRASLRNSIGSASASRGGTPRKHMSAVTDEEAEYVKVKLVHRKTVGEKLKEALQKVGPRHQRCE
jgi:nucleoporin NUP159